MNLLANLFQLGGAFGKAAVAHQGQKASSNGAMRGDHAECTPCAANSYINEQRKALSGTPAKKRRR